ncbi:MAG: Nucleoside triphosphatase NudI [Nitrosomonadaceae bacterium]|nr:Nucleoside triphosphatase NudI [Nitrosomonadaceae bacterium]
MAAVGIKRVSLGLLKNRGVILLYLRDNKQEIPYPNYWALLGGQIEEGETPQAALEREIQEEIGCKAHSISFVGRLDVVNNPMCEDHTIFLFKGEIRNRFEEMRLTEGQKLGYFTMEKFRALRFPGFLREFILKEIMWEK